MMASGSPFPHQNPAKRRVRMIRFVARTFSTHPPSPAQTRRPRLLSEITRSLQTTFRTLLARWPIRTAAERETIVHPEMTMFSEGRSHSVMPVTATQSSAQ